MPTPTPVVPQPVTPTSPANSTLTFSVSGMLPVSGEPGVGALSGPFMIEEQTLNINYVRVPRFAEDSSGTFLSLSAPEMGWRVNATHLQVKATAVHSRTKSYDFYHTSGWQQSQNFAYNAASADAFGSTYGGIGVSALGPAGSVETSAAYYSRRPWVEGIDTSSFERAEGTRHYYYNVTSGGVGPEMFADGMTHFGDFERQDPYATQGPTWIGNSEKNAWGDVFLYWFAGPYATSLETPLSIQNFIDGLADTISSPYASNGLFGIGDDFVVEEGAYNWSPKRTQRCTGYNKNRHQWNTV